MRQDRVQARLSPTSKSCLRLQTANSMATLTLQRASWCLQISRTSRTFAVSFTTALPRKGKPRHLPQDFSSPLRETSNPLHSSREDAARRSTRQAETKRAFTSTRVYRAQQEAASPASRPTSLDAQQPQPPESILPDTRDLTSGLNDQNVFLDEGARQVDWTRSFHGLSNEAFSPEAAKALLAPIEPDEIEVKPDGIIYLPEIKYRRILNKAFGPGGWGLAPRGETIVTAKAVTREYALVALGRYSSTVTLFPDIWLDTLLITFSTGSYPSLAGSKITSRRKAFPPQSKDASLQLLDAAARISVWRASYGIQDSFGSFWRSM